MRVGILKERLAEEYPQVKCSSTVCSSTSVVFVFPTCAPSPILQLPSPSVSSAAACAPVATAPAATMGGQLGIAARTAGTKLKSGGECELPWPPAS